ncbi:MAG: glycerol-3-phosphate 1-O-acyltransferase PlsY [Sulfuriferula sp.]|nr:glycerol-3-phosphate 1-O-acyltransferase PlsY [Sulfuriferula sp.]
MMAVAVVVLAYLLGSLSFAVLVSRAFGLPDPRSHGSGNPGATNMLRTGRKSAAVLTLLGDMAKGWLAVSLAGYLSARYQLPEWVIYAAAVAVFLGHLYPVFFGFKGGKGVATAVGVLFAISPWLGLVCLLTWIAVFAITRISSLAALIAAAVAPLFGYYLLGDVVALAALSVLTVLIFWRHRANIRRLLSGEEGRFVKK